MISRLREAAEYYFERLSEEPVWRAFGLVFDDSGMDVLEQDWQYLFICDSARYDMFEETNPIPGALSSVRSKGGKTAEFLEGNFGKEYHDDIVYVSATPRASEYLRERVHEYIPVWESEWNGEEWRDSEEMVPAEKMHEYCLQAIASYPEKRIVFHFLQPHLSIHTSEATSAEAAENSGDKTVLRKLLEGKISKSFAGRSAWVQFQEGEISRETVWSAQTEKLESFFTTVESILPYCSEPTVITSDHGNCYGEKLHPWLPLRVYEHPKQMNHPKLRTVPWLRVDSSVLGEGNISDISVDDSLIDSERPDDGSVEDRLRDLGYMS